MAKRGRPAKGKFDSLAEEFKEEIEKADAAAIDAKIAEVAKNEEENLKLKKEDQHLAEVKIQYDDAKAGYVEATKANKLKIKYCIEILKARGKG